MSNKRLETDRARAFTLVELLTVLAVVALLAGLLLPALSQARERARAARCFGQVRQIGAAIHAYVNDGPDRLPLCSRLGPEPRYGLPSLPQALETQLDGHAVFHCPSDLAANAYYPEFGTSYEWNTFLNGRQIDRATWRLPGLEIASPLLGDADAFHSHGTRNYLYADGHVSSSLEILIQAAP